MYLCAHPPIHLHIHPSIRPKPYRCSYTSAAHPHANIHPHICMHVNLHMQTHMCINTVWMHDGIITQMGLQWEGPDWGNEKRRFFHEAFFAKTWCISGPDPALTGTQHHSASFPMGGWVQPACGLSLPWGLRGAAS